VGKRLLLLLPTRTYKAKDYLDAAHVLGAEVVAASEEPGGLVSFDFNDPSKALKHGPFDAVIGVDDGSIQAASRISKTLGLRANPPEAVDAARNKKVMRELFLKGGVRVPEFADAGESCPLPFPCVVKATSLSASRGVIRADTQEQYSQALVRIRELLKNEEDNNPIIVESFLAGPEVALDGLLSAGKLRTLALFDKPETPDGPFFPETMLITPSGLSQETQEAIRLESERAAAALGLIEGPIHAEFRVTPDGPVILEIAARTIGGSCSSILTFGTGVTLEELVLRNALGLDAALFERERSAAGICMILPESDGVISSVDGIEEARLVPGIEQVVFPNRGNRRVSRLPEGGAYAGFLFAKGKTPEEVVKALKSARSMITLHYK